MPKMSESKVAKTAANYANAHPGMQKWIMNFHSGTVKWPHYHDISNSHKNVLKSTKN